MRTHREGFSLIDVVIGLLISAILSMVLYRVFSQTMRIAHVSDGLIEDYSDVLIMSAQLERDISSVVVLKEHEKLAEKKPEEAKKTAAGETAEKSSAIELADDAKKDEAGKKEEEQLAFSGIIKDNKLDRLSFVSTNALPQADQAGSRLVRVRYFLEPDLLDSNLSRLMREESPYAPQNASHQATGDRRTSALHAYTIMPHVESLTMKFYGTVHVPAGSQKSSDSGTETLALSSWGNEEQRKKLKRLVPEYVAFEGTYRSHATRDAVPFSLLIAVPAGIAAGVEGREREKQEAEQAAKKKGAS